MAHNARAGSQAAKVQAELPDRGEGLAWHAARLRAHIAAAPLPTTVVALSRAVGRTLAAPLLAIRPLPGFDSAAMDGYAVCGNGPWLLEGRILAGEAPGQDLQRGRAREIATGAPVPVGTHAVIPYEDARRCGELLNGYQSSPHIRRTGEEAVAGEQLVAAATVINPQTVALAAALGYDELVVARRPRVAAIITGDEILSYGAPPPGRLRDAIGPASRGWVPAVGAQLSSLTYVNDYRDVLLDALDGCDTELIAVSGSSSVGRADYLRAGLEQIGAEPIVGEVACRPGHTQSLWRLADGRLVVGLPGNPFAALAAFLTLIVPCCVGMLGRDLDPLRRISVGALWGHPTKTRLVPVRLGQEQIQSISYDGSAMLRGLAVADALAVVPPARASHDRVELLPLPGNPVPITPSTSLFLGKDQELL